jgi:hypothetical protein
VSDFSRAIVLILRGSLKKITIFSEKSIDIPVVVTFLSTYTKYSII